MHGRHELYIFDGHSVTSVCYFQQVILSHVHFLFRGVIGPNFIFIDDNARSHNTHTMNELLESENISRLDWPARVLPWSQWTSVGCCISTGEYTTVKTIYDRWMGIPILKIGDTLVLSRLNRCLSATEVKGELTFTKELLFTIIPLCHLVFYTTFFAQQSPFLFGSLQCPCSLFLRYTVLLNVCCLDT